MDTLGSAANFLSANEHVIRVAQTLIFRTRHSIKWPNGSRIFVQHKKICVVFFFDCPS